MKNIKLQELLKKYPDDIEVTVGNTDIVDLEQMWAYWDGHQEILIRDDALGGRIIGAKYRAHGHKVKIHIMSIEDLLISNPDIPIDVSELPEHDADYSKRIEQWKNEGYKIQEIIKNRRKINERQN